MVMNCDECPFWNLVDVNLEDGSVRYECTASTLEDFDIIDEHMCCQRSEDKENLEESLDEMIETNMGTMPIEDYLEIVAMQHGYGSYNEMQADGIVVDVSGSTNSLN